MKYIRLDSLCFYMIVVFSFSISFVSVSPVFPNLMISLLAVLGLFRNGFGAFFSNIYNNKVVFYNLLFLFLLLISCFFSSDKLEGIKVIRTKLYLILVPLVLFQFKLYEGQMKKVLYSFVLGVLLVTTICFFFAIVNFTKTGDYSYFLVERLSEFINIQPTFLSLYVFSALVIAAFCFLYDFGFITEVMKYLLVFSLAIFSFFIVCLGSKIFILFYVAFCTCFLCKLYRKYFRRQLAFFTLLSGVIISFVFFIINFSPIKNRFRGIADWNSNINYLDTRPELHHSESDNTEDFRWTTISFRYALLVCNLEVVKKNFIFGVGIGDRSNAYCEVYKSKSFKKALLDRSLSHNIYLDLLAAVGIVGLLLFLYPNFYMSFSNVLKNNNITFLIILTSIYIASLFESYLDRAHTVLLLSFFVSLSSCNSTVYNNK